MQGTGFSGSQFQESTDFSKSVFDRETFFRFAQFEKGAKFRAGVFHRTTDFTEARFGGETDFSGVVFNQPPQFTDKGLAEQFDPNVKLAKGIRMGADIAGIFLPPPLASLMALPMNIIPPNSLIKI